jgi:gp32 DNA binding protein like
MAMDLSSIKSKLAALQNPRQGGGQKRDMSLILWKPTVGKHSVRIVPSVLDASNPFKEVYVHYGIGNRTMIALTNFGEKDPIVELAKQLRQSGDKENWSMARKLDAKMRVFTPVIVRGEEEKGVRLWEFGKQVYQELLSIADDPDVGDYTDPIQGRDITIETTDPTTNGTSYNQSKVRVRTKITPLSENATEVKKWLTEQPDAISIFKRYDYEEMKAALVDFLHPEDKADEVTPVVEEVAAPVAAAKPASFALSTKKSEVDIDEEFNELFNIK